MATYVVMYTTTGMSTVPSFPTQTVNGTTNSSENVPTTCMLISSSDGSGDLISPETNLLIGNLKSAVIIPLLFLFGGPTNILNMIVFFRQGLQDRVNLCLFSLAVADFCTISFYFLISVEKVFMFTTNDTYGTVGQFLANNKALIFYSFAYASMLIIVIISVERCLCVLLPLRAKLLLKTKYMAAIVCTGPPSIGLLRLVVTAKYAVACVFDERTHRTFMALYTTDYAIRNKELLAFIDGVFYGFVLAVGCPCIVLITTLITTVKLWQGVAWRRETSSANTRKEAAVTRMLVLLSLEFLTFAIPLLLMRIYPLFNTEFSAKGRYRYFFSACASIAELLLCIGSSFSFFVYYFASFKYRETCQSFLKLQCCVSKSNNNNMSEKRRKGLPNRYFVSSRRARNVL